MKNKVPAILLLVFAQVAPAVTIAFDPDAQNVQLGNQALVNVVASDLDTNQVIGAYDLTFQWNSTILSFGSVTLGSVLGGMTLDSIVGGTAQANVAQVSFELPATLAPLQATEPFTLFSIRFNTLSAGTSPLSFAASPLVISDGDGNIISGVTTGTGSITVVGNGPVIPEPSTVMLLGTGIGALLCLRHRRRS